MTRQLPINQQDTKLVDNFHRQIADLIHGNHVDKSEVKNIGCETCRCHIGYKVNWQFVPQVDTQKFRGNYAVSQHFGYNFSQFEQETRQRLAIGKTHKPIRENFTHKILEQDGQSLADAAKQHRVWDFGQHSVNEECSPCRGSGSVTCSACGGSCRQTCFGCGGRGSTTQTRWVQDYNGQSRSETYQQSCYGCGGSGTQTCNRCSGSGKQQCNQCSGQGLFTYIAQVVVQAKASIQISVESALSQAELLEFLLRYPVTHIVDYLDIKFSGHRDIAEDVWQLAYQAESKVIELDIGLRKKQYLAAALGESVLAFRKPPIFDDLFIEEITDLKKIFAKSKKLNHQLARKFFENYSGQPVLDEAMKNIAKLKGDTQQASREVINCCKGYISSNSADLLAQSVVKLLDKVSPPNSFWSWMAIMFLPFLLMFFSTQALFETVSRDWLNTFVAALLAFASALVATLVISPLAVLVSSVVSYWRRRSVPAEYRQRGRNWQPLGFFIKSAMLVSLLGMSVGLLARHDWIPRWQNKPLLTLANVIAPYVNPYVKHNQQSLYHQPNYNQTNLNQATQNKPQTDQPNRQSERTKPVTKTVSTNTIPIEKADPLVLDIQHNLIRLGYDLTVTGSVDNKTRQAMQAYANKNAINDQSTRNLLISLCRELKGRCSNAAKIQY